MYQKSKQNGYKQRRCVYFYISIQVIPKIRSSCKLTHLYGFCDLSMQTLSIGVIRNENINKMISCVINQTNFILTFYLFPSDVPYRNVKYFDVFFVRDCRIVLFFHRCEYNWLSYVFCFSVAECVFGM